MAGPIAVDTPDYQRGIANPQVLLATVPGGTGLVVVGIPTNAESLIVVAAQGVAPQSCTVIGQTTGLTYAGSRVASPIGAANVDTYLFDISTVLDQQVEVVLSAIPAGTWYVYADAGVHVVADSSKLVNKLGQQYVIPTIPGVDTNDHPANEVNAFGGQYGSGTIVISAPGAGNRIRLFSLNMAVSGAGGVWVAQNGSGSIHYLWCVGTGQNLLQIPDQGVPMPTNDNLNVYNWTGGGTLFMSGLYTVETV